MSTEQAIRWMRTRPEHAATIRDAYLGVDVDEASERFTASAEFRQVQALLDGAIRGSAILDLGAGNGIVARAFAKAGARVVYAVEPDLSSDIGGRAIRRLCGDSRIQVIAGVGERLPLLDEQVDVVYARQVLHHTQDLYRVGVECSRVLRSGGLMLICREHVVDDQRQLEQFRKEHPVHRLAGGENAFPLAMYVDALKAGGFELVQVFGPWDTVINAFPEARSEAELKDFAAIALRRRFGPMGRLAGAIPGAHYLVWKKLRGSRRAGRHYSFLARKP